MGQSYLSARRLWSNDPLRSWRERSLLFRANSWVRKCLRQPFVINFSKIELEITTDCGLKCNNCDRSCGQAPSREEMSLEQISKFIDESIRLDKRWAKIAIQGGEPLHHTRALEILDAFAEYKRRHSPNTNLRLTTSGWGKKVKMLLPDVPKEFFILNTEKVPLGDARKVTLQGHYPRFDTTQLAPIDVGMDCSAMNFRSGCSITEGCGIALTRYGYFPCGAGASVARVFQYDVGIMALSDISEDRFRGCLDILCRHCGHFKSRSRYKFPSPTILHSWDQVTSPSWKDALSRYDPEQVLMTLY